MSRLCAGVSTRRLGGTMALWETAPGFIGRVLAPPRPPRHCATKVQMTGPGGPVSGVALGSFQLLQPLASGAMASVWRALHRPTSTPVAVKVMTAEMARTPGFVLCFRNEVEAVARLDHRGIVRVYD